MPDNKNFETSDFAKLFQDSSSNNSLDPIWILIMCMLLMEFWPNSNSTESFLKGKIEAYENVLKGFDCNER